MDYIPVTPFRRAMDAAQIQHLRAAPAVATGVMAANKWHILRDITAARAALGVSDRDITLLQALLGFHPGTELVAGSPQLVIFPSNLSICERLNGMPQSTMRRHLARLVDQGLITRRDSPNGKRYCRRGRGGTIHFGLDLTPLLARATEITALAEAAREAEATLAQMRQNVSLMRRDLQALVRWGMEALPTLPHWPRLQDLLALTARDLRRRPVLHDLEALQQIFQHALEEVNHLLSLGKSGEMSTSALQNEQHHQISNKELYESEPAMKHCTPKNENVPACIDAEDREQTTQTSAVPLAMVLAACSEVQSYAPSPITSWPMLIALCDTLRPMVGITAETWFAAKNSLGSCQAAAVLSAMFQRIVTIRSPGAYLRRLCQKATEGLFSPLPMVRSLLPAISM